MIHKRVEEAYRCMDQYHIPREVEMFEMMYCFGRLDAAKGKKEAMTTLNAHLEKHYELKAIAEPMCYVYEGGIESTLGDAE